jgi:HIRAN domain
MSQNLSLALIDPALLALIHGSFGGTGGLMPFTQEIMLLECEIAGTSYREVKTADSLLTPGAVLILQREPTNQYDPLAIMILSSEGHHLGYVPRAKNEVLARLMDAGKLLFGKLETKEWIDEWLKVELRIYLREI